MKSTKGNTYSKLEFCSEEEEEDDFYEEVNYVKTIMSVPSHLKCFFGGIFFGCRYVRDDMRCPACIFDCIFII